MLNLRHKTRDVFVPPEAPRRLPAWASPAIKFAVGTLLCYVLWRQLVAAGSGGNLLASLRGQLAVQPLWPLLVVVALMPVNLILEALKFRALLDPFGAAARGPGTTLVVSLRRVLAGLTVGIVTPNRVGEYAGRLAGAAPGERSATIAATVLGGVGQLLALVGGGAIALASLARGGGGREVLSAAGGVGPSAIAVAVALACACFVLLPRLLAVTRIASRMAGLRPRSSRLGVLRDVAVARLRAAAATPVTVYAAALGYSAVRYGVYLAQIALTFAWFGFRFGFESGVGGVVTAGGAAGLGIIVAGTAVVLLGQTFVPLPAFFQAVARVEIAALVWAGTGVDLAALTLASLFVFVLNLALPALVGLAVILRSDVDRTLQID